MTENYVIIVRKTHPNGDPLSRMIKIVQLQSKGAATEGTEDESRDIGAAATGRVTTTPDHRASETSSYKGHKVEEAQGKHWLLSSRAT